MKIAPSVLHLKMYNRLIILTYMYHIMGAIITLIGAIVCFAIPDKIFKIIINTNTGDSLITSYFASG